MRLTSTVVDQRAVVTVAGELDIATADELRGYLHKQIDAGSTAMVLDLSGVDFLDSSTLGVLIKVHNRLREAGGALDLVCPHERLLRIFRMTGLDRLFTIYPSMGEAVV